MSVDELALHRKITELSAQWDEAAKAVDETQSKVMRASMALHSARDAESQARGQAAAATCHRDNVRKQLDSAKLQLGELTYRAQVTKAKLERDEIAFRARPRFGFTDRHDQDALDKLKEE